MLGVGVSEIPAGQLSCVYLASSQNSPQPNLKYCNNELASAIRQLDVNSS